MSKSLILFSIGPVQNFIDKARKTSDLYAGSRLLSDLTEFAMDILKEREPGADIVFPDEELKSKPNRFVAVIKHQKCLEELKKTCIDVERSVKRKMALTAKGLLRTLGHEYEPAGFVRQTESFLEVYWVVLPIKEQPYHVRYREIDRLLNAVKNTRIFEQLTEGITQNQVGETGRKCSLCGERNALVFSTEDKESDKINPKTGLKRRFIAPAAVNIYHSLQKKVPLSLAEGEGLCAVCFTKRFYRDGESSSAFPSTAEIALMDTLHKLDNRNMPNYRKLFGDVFDEALFYEENLTESYFKKFGYPIDIIEQAKTMLKHIYEGTKKIGLKFTSYYAVVILDGDDMGRWLSGEFLKDQSRLMRFHKSLSKKLGGYAQEINKILVPPKGRVVYAGGDDVLGFINLNHLTGVLDELRGKFPKLEELETTCSEKKSSASLGVAVAHYKTPLSEVLTWARRMKDEAKREEDKNSLAVALIKRSGETVKTIFGWEMENGILITQALGKITDELKQGNFSKSFIKNIRAEFNPLLDSDGRYNARYIVREEIKRLVSRACMIKKGPDEDERDFENRKRLKTSELVGTLLKLLSKSRSLNDYFNLLDIAAFIGKEVNDEQGKFLKNHKD